MSTPLSKCAAFIAMILLAIDSHAETSVPITFEVPAEVAKNQGLFAAQIVRIDGTSELGLLRERPATAAVGERLVTLDVTRRELDSVTFCFSVSSAFPNGTYHLPVRNLQADAAKIAVPKTFAVLNWLVPTELCEELGISIASSSLVLTKIVPDTFGTKYHPLFYGVFSFRETDSGLSAVAYCPFVEPGIYEVGVKSAKHTGLRLRRRIEWNAGRDILPWRNESSMDALLLHAKESLPQKFARADIVPPEIVRQTFVPREDLR